MMSYNLNMRLIFSMKCVRDVHFFRLDFAIEMKQVNKTIAIH